MKKKVVAMIAALSLVMTTLAGCGSDDSSTDTSAGSADTESSAEEESTDTASEEEEEDSGELIEINAAYMANYASLWALATAVEKGYMEEEGLDVTLQQFQDGPTEIAAMESGSIDVAYIGPGAHTLCIQGEASIFCFSHLGDADCVMGLKSHGVESLEDLEGKKVAYASGTSSETILVRALNSVGLTMDDIEAYDMEVSNMVNAMISGSIDACAPWSPNSTTIVEELGDDVEIFCTNTTFSDISCDIASFVCEPSYAEENEEILVKFTRALYKAFDYASQEENYEEVAEYVAEYCGTDVDSALEQTGDGEWLTSEEVIAGCEDGTIEGYYEVQQQAFIDSGDITEDEAVPVEDYVLFDIMLEAGEEE